jgi:hypothetical protein
MVGVTPAWALLQLVAPLLRFLLSADGLADLTGYVFAAFSWHWTYWGNPLHFFRAIAGDLF